MATGETRWLETSGFLVQIFAIRMWGNQDLRGLPVFWYWSLDGEEFFNTIVALGCKNCVYVLQVGRVIIFIYF